MGTPDGFLKYERKDAQAYDINERIKNYNEFHTPLSEREQKKQGERCMNCGVPFCQSGMKIGGMISGCPLNNLIPEWNHLVSIGAWKQAYNRLRLTNNFPEFTSRVCPALCEKACTCGANGDAVTVRANEYSIIEKAYSEGLAVPQPPKVRTGKKIAVIGSGPSGLAAADQLNKRGHSVTVYERSDRVGGLLMYGIPNMKLEKHIIERKVNIMKAEGITFVTNTNVGADITADDIMKQYDKVILACGASHPRDINVPGRDAEGIYFAVDFLRSTTKALLDNGLAEGTFISAKDKNVIVIGGGDTGNDCVGTCVRHGAKSVMQLEMMPRLPDERAENNPWPEWPRVCKTDYGQEEAAAVYGNDPRVYTTTVKEFLRDENGRLRAAVLVKLSSERDAATGRMTMKPVEGSEYTVDAELVLIAAGFLGSESYVTQAFGVETDARTNVSSPAGSHRTNVENVYAAGDMHIGQSLVVRAIREGRDCAKEVDLDLMGYTNL
ncbi:MAG: glutamate synthase subunit beta [Clostridia bacterium]|nr:glutamate synthase subunit beta [Clostridia bacterium]